MKYFVKDGFNFSIAGHAMVYMHRDALAIVKQGLIKV